MSMRPAAMSTDSAPTSRIGDRAGVLSAAVVLGAVSGVLAKMADETQVGWLNDLGTYPAIWMLVIVVISVRAPGPPVAAGVATAFFLSLTLGYYAYARLVLGFGSAREELIWLVAGLTLAPISAALLHWSHSSPRWWASVVPAIYAGLMLSSGPLRQYVLHFQSALPEQIRLRPVQALVDIAVALTIVALIPSTSRSRRLAIALTIPAVLAAPTIIQTANNIAYS